MRALKKELPDSPEEIVEAVRYQIKYGAKVIKTCADQKQFNEDELRIMADAAHRSGVKLAVHAGKLKAFLMQ